MNQAPLRVRQTLYLVVDLNTRSVEERALCDRYLGDWSQREKSRCNKHELKAIVARLAQLESSDA